MIVDMGGGTVDLITYRLIRIEPLQLEEACVGQGEFRSRRKSPNAKTEEGGKCGGTTIDRNLHKLLQERFGIAFKGLPPGKTGSNSFFMKVFEEIKRDFKGILDEKKVYKLPLKMKKLDVDEPEMVDWYDFEEDMIKLRG